MLKKLLRHEWLESWKVPALIGIIVAVLSAASAVYFRFAPPLTSDVELHVGNLILFTSYTLVVCSVGLILTIYLGVRFY